VAIIHTIHFRNALTYTYFTFGCVFNRTPTFKSASRAILYTIQVDDVDMPAYDELVVYRAMIRFVLPIYFLHLLIINFQFVLNRLNTICS